MRLLHRGLQLCNSYIPRSYLIKPSYVTDSITRSSFKSFYSTKIQLRPYQEECIQNCLSELDNGNRRIAVSLPTGGGKTVIFSNLIQRVKPTDGYGDKTMILVHRKELAVQAAETCKRVYPDKVVELEMSEFKATENADIVIASTQTLIRGRLSKFDPKDFKLLIVDECHHAAANSYIEIMDHFGIKDSKSDIALVGFSATVRREDEKSLHVVFDKIVFHMSLDQMITNKHLSDAKFTTVRLTDSDLSNTKSRAGDFVISSLSKEVNKPQNNELVLRTYLHFVQQHKIKSTLLFGVDTQHVEDLYKLFKERGVSADYVTSKSRKSYRDLTVKNFKDGELSVLMNCGLFTEGTDMPNIDCILLVRPTKSKTLLIQMIGRGLRLHQSKEHCHVVDFIGINNGSIVSTPTLRNLPPDFEFKEMSLVDMEKAKQKLDEKRLKEDEDKEKQEAIDEEKDKQENQKLLNKYLHKGHQLPEIREEDFEDLELTTFDSLSDFVQSTHGRKDDFFYIRTSKYRWVRGPTKHLWILKYPGDFTGSHLRLEIHPTGFKKSFTDEVSIDEVYKSSGVKDLKIKAYTLSLYYEREEYSKKIFYSSSRRYNYEKRFATKLLIPASTDIRVPLSYVETIFTTHFPYVDLTKFAKWRNEQPSNKQKDALKKIIDRYFKDTSPQLRQFLKEKTSSLNKGDVHDVFLVNTVFKGKGFKQILNKYVKEFEKIQEEKEAENNKAEEIHHEIDSAQSL